MNYQTFNRQKLDILNLPFFFGQNVNVARYDIQRHPFIESLIDKQLSFFWRPEEINLTGDIKDVYSLSDSERHFFISNLRYQILLDSVQSRGPNVAFLPIVSCTELETWIINWTFSETLHSRSYSHILSILPLDPDQVFGGITEQQEIINRAADVTKYYDDLIHKVNLYYANNKLEGFINGQYISIRDLKKSLYLCLNAVNALEAIRFLVSFICTFLFTENKKMEGCSKIIQFIARDENIHNTALEYVINAIDNGMDLDPELRQIGMESKDECAKMFISVAEQEKQWAQYLFSQGNIFDFNQKDLYSYIDFVTYHKMKKLGMEYHTKIQENPIPWSNKYFDLNNLQSAPQETELVNYLTGQVNSDLSINSNKITKFKL